MDAFADKLGRIGAWCGQNKYLGAIKNAFQNFMPATIAGAIGVLWTNVLVHKTTGLGALWDGIMVLEVLNPIFAAIQFATISCISIGIVMLVAQEIGEANGETGAFPAVLGFIAWLVVTPNSYSIADMSVTITEVDQYGANLSETVGKLLEGNPLVAEIGSFGGISSSYTGATGLFTALIIGILAMELYGFLRKQDALKIKMPEQVPPGVSRAFEVLIPSFIMLVIVGGIGHACFLGTGLYVNDIISKYIQAPLQEIIGNNLFAVMFMYVLISLFWLVGIHGNNMLAAIKEPLFKPALYTNMAIFQEKQTGEYATFNITMMQMFAEWGGSGVTLGLVIAIFIFGKREDNRAIATLSVVPGLFNINETVTFGIPLVLNPILGIPFIIAPVACIALGWALIEMNFCPPIVLEVPWTMPPLFLGFLATGGSPMGAISQLIAIALSTVIYIPFVIMYERYQNKQAAEA
ncbi:MAG: PTS transporter subunit EIIC [Erysipelotrichales bacterium]|nr:PTS transporter subunit EIIC [Erysipelotrichales bacterium]